MKEGGTNIAMIAREKAAVSRRQAVRSLGRWITPLVPPSPLSPAGPVPKGVVTVPVQLFAPLD